MPANNRPPVAYTPEIESISADEAEVIEALEELFVDMATTVSEKEGHAHRAVHAKGQGLLRAEVDVHGGLAAHLAHGLFAQPRRYSAVMRLSSPPAEQLSDDVSTPRAIALKVLGVEGDRVECSRGQDSQDFLMVNGPKFTVPGPSGFLRNFRMLAKTTERMPKTKAYLSKVLRGTEALVEKAGGVSGKLREMGGQPQVHPLGETFFTQVPFRYGPFMSKFSLVPVSANLTDLKDQKIGNQDDAQRDAVRSLIGNLTEPAIWELRVQLCRDLETMPIEDASVEWPQEDSPYETVATVRVLAQNAWDDAAAPKEEDGLAFSPWHALEAHRPLGALNRARRVVMPASQRFRAGFNRCPIHDIPDTGENS
jgi:hypothetical protein